MVKTGLEVFLDQKKRLIRNARAGLLAHPASVDSRLRHAVDLLHSDPDINLTALFGPQHGIRGETQDNMIEWRSFRDPQLGIPVYSLYGQTRVPTEEMLRDVDVLIFDLQDVGTRVYTFIWTMVLAMQAAKACAKRVIVLDRPNPIGGVKVEGNIGTPEFVSFVGLIPLPMRHGMTAGELALYFNQEHSIGCDLEVVAMEGWSRNLWFDQTGLPWVMPSPNMPAIETAAVYPGSVMLEGTQVSEGRGTTRPFEILGAPFINGCELAAALTECSLAGAGFRPLSFQPTFHKHTGQLCGGVQIHVIDRESFEPWLTGLTIVRLIRDLYSRHFAWKEPPYEYVHHRLPFDVICGTDRVRCEMEAGTAPREIDALWAAARAEFETQRKPYLLY